jgi:hypothetical protein
LTFVLYANAQYINGYVIDTDIKQPLKGVVVSVLNINAESDSIGFWRLQIEIPVGTYSVKFQFLGYESVIVSDVSISAGKQRNLFVNMKELLTELDEIIITPDSRNYGKISRMQINSAELSHIPGEGAETASPFLLPHSPFLLSVVSSVISTEGRNLNEPPRPSL